jgi:hypothetical protein
MGQTTVSFHSTRQAQPKIVFRGRYGINHKPWSVPWSVPGSMLVLAVLAAALYLSYAMNAWSAIN